MRIAALALLLLPVITGCADTTGTPAQVSALPSATGGVAMLADALAAADRAASAGDEAGLARSLATISALDPRPLDPSGAARLAQWQSQTPDAPPLRGRTLGPGFRTGTLTGGGELRIEQTFLSGQKATVALSTPGSTPGGSKLRLQVIDSAAKPVCRNLAKTTACEWIPIFTQRHVIQLNNPDHRDARFYLVIG